ncbi:MAG: class 1 fructose-bisphosphatase [Polyangia bacterium]
MVEAGWENVRTLESYINREQRLHPNSRGVFSDLLRRIGVASKIIGIKLQKAGLLEVMGARDLPDPGSRDISRAQLMAHEIMQAALKWLSSVAGLASREEPAPIPIEVRRHDGDRYIVLFDALDGASNIGANVSAGTIFSIYRCRVGQEQPVLEDILQAGHRQVAAGYVIYGSSTMFVFTTGHGVQGFTLDPEIGEYVLSHEDILIPDRCKCFSANVSQYLDWDEPTRRFADHVRGDDEPRYRKTSSRYIGSLVADFHRNLLYGGVYLYPLNARTGASKLRLMFECAPLAMIVEQAGGEASTGRERILEIQPGELHQNVPFVIGTRAEVELYEKMVREHDIATGRVRPSVPPPSP